MRTLFLLVLLMGLAGSASAQFVAEDATAIAGAPLRLTVPPTADTLFVTYRPGSRLATTAALPTGGRSTLRWTPATVGLARLSVADGPSQNVAIRATATPRRGILVLLLAGGCLASGALLAARGLTAHHENSP